MNLSKLTNLTENITPESGHEIFSKVLAQHYEKLGKDYLVKSHLKEAEKYLKLAVAAYTSPHALELLGNIFLEKKLYNIAATYYLRSLIANPYSFWAYHNIIKCHIEQNKYDIAIIYINRALYKIPQKTSFIDKLDEVANQYWNKERENLSKIIDERKKIIAQTFSFSKKIYDAYFQIYNRNAEIDINVKNKDKILIVGDFHIPQCVRYRIQQKKEQLKLNDKKVELIDWHSLNNNLNKIYLNDIIIFYRTPAVPIVIKAIAIANATGKLSIFEIDDLLFNEAYPAPIETYGGYLNTEEYQGLVCDSGLFYTSAKLCQIGIGSTLPLVRQIKTLVTNQHCILHRNGIDSSHKVSSPEKTSDSVVKLFYGSGTKAHNSDFNELIIPALEKLMGSYNVTLTIAGYLELPSKFLSQFKEKIKLIPFSSNYKDYLSLLSMSDINVATLHEDVLNNCKSELKWMEAALFKIPSIVSSTENYRDVINHTENGFLAKNTQDWTNYLEILIKDSDLRKKIGNNAHAKVIKQYNAFDMGKKLYNEILSYIEKMEKRKSQVRKKKVALVNVFFYPQTIGGATRVVNDNFDILIDQYKEDYEICVFTSDADHREGSQYKLELFIYKGIRIYRCGILWREHMDWHAEDKEITPVFANFLKKEKPDIVHFHCIQRLTASTVEATKSLNIPYIITIHDAWWISDFQFLVDQNNKVYPNGHLDLYEEINLPDGISLDKSLKRRYYLKSLLLSAKYILTVSDKFADIYKKNGFNNIKVTKNGISKKINWEPKDTKYTERVVCAHIGGMSAHKGYLILQAAVQSQNFTNLEFLIVDHSKESDYQHTETWGGSNVTFIGRQPQEDIVNLYKKIDVLLAPSIWPESFGLVTREAAACGCWVVASDLGGIGEDIIENQTGHIIKPTESEIKHILEKINVNYQTYKKLSYPSPSRFSEHQVKEIVKFYGISL